MLTCIMALSVWFFQADGAVNKFLMSQSPHPPRKRIRLVRTPSDATALSKPPNDSRKSLLNVEVVSSKQKENLDTDREATNSSCYSTGNVSKPSSASSKLGELSALMKMKFDQATCRSFKQELGRYIQSGRQDFQPLQSFMSTHLTRDDHRSILHILKMHILRSSHQKQLPSLFCFDSS